MRLRTEAAALYATISTPRPLRWGPFSSNPDRLSALWRGFRACPAESRVRAQAAAARGRRPHVHSTPPRNLNHTPRERRVFQVEMCRGGVVCRCAGVPVLRSVSRNSWFSKGPVPPNIVDPRSSPVGAVCYSTIRGGQGPCTLIARRSVFSARGGPGRPSRQGAKLVGF